MAIRIRKDGRMLCAKYHKEEEGDIYVNDSIHEWLSGCRGNKPLLNFYNYKAHEWFVINPDIKNKDILNITKQYVDEDGTVKYF